MAGDPYKYFRVEARELLDVLGRGALDLEKAPPSADLMARLLRAAHTLKGAARVVKQGRIADHAHRLEDVFTGLRDQAVRPSREDINGVLGVLDEISACVATLDDDGRQPAAGAAPAAERQEPARFARLETADLNAVAHGVTEAQGQIGNLRQHFHEIRRIGRLVDLASVQLAQPRIEHAAATLEDVRIRVSALQRELSSAVDQIDRETHALADAAARLRLAPAAALFAFLERAARDVSVEVGKPVAFVAHGGEVRLDPEVLTMLQGALLQLVRNAVAHGIEPATTRRAAGKPMEGRVTVSVARRGSAITFTCADDGGGIDFAAVRRALETRGSRVLDDGLVDEARLVQRLLEGGITTSPRVSGVAGRGIGLDIVREAAERLGGRVALKTEAGQGTTIELAVPAVVASFEALLVEAGGTMAAVPLDAVTRTIRVTAGDIVETDAGQAVFAEGRTIQLRSLARILRPGQPQANAADNAPAFVVEAGGRGAAFSVDRVLGVATVVAQPMPALAPALEVIAGAALDATGAPRLVLDPNGLVASGEAIDARHGSEPPARKSILVVDDSLTTRMLEQSILESAGYDVALATSAEEGLEKARRGAYALFLVDVEMPGMDGFTFIEQVRADPLLRGIPAILVTSRASVDDRQRGREVGAQGYIVKSDFDQRALLEQIGALVR